MLARRRILLIIAISVFVFTSCDKAKITEEPKNALNEFVQKSFAIKKLSQKEELLELVTGAAYDSIEAYPDDEFKKDFIDRDWSFVKMDYKDVKQLSGEAVNITYELSYKVKIKNQNANVTNKKLAFVVKEDDRWRISSVKNIREVIDYTEDLQVEAKKK